jgi:hypothetical protein
VSVNVGEEAAVNSKEKEKLSLSLAWFDDLCASRAKVPCDLDDPQIICQTIWDKKPFIWVIPICCHRHKTRQSFPSCTNWTRPKNCINKHHLSRWSSAKSKGQVEGPSCHANHAVALSSLDVTVVDSSKDCRAMIHTAVGCDGCFQSNVSASASTSINNKGLTPTESKLSKNPFCNCWQLAIWS